MRKLFDALQEIPSYQRVILPRVTEAPVYEYSVEENFRDYGLIYHLGFQYHQKVVVPESNELRDVALQDAKRIFKRQLYNMAYGEVIPLLHELERYVKYLGDSRVGEKFGDIYSVVKGYETQN